jgi:prolyl-tRNA editing enzyme YbaK/EbsC (Cys-tRNA(Pro) deacylase)
VPPFGHAVPLPTLVDAQVMNLPRIYGGTSDPNVLVSVPSGEIERLAPCTVVALMQP